MGVADPLLEVLVHWLKGGEATPLSWDVVVATLREPNISEADLADKIHRLYCDHKQEEKEMEKKWKEAQADSGV